MVRRFGIAVLVSLLVVTAGCASQGDGGDGAVTTTSTGSGGDSTTDGGDGAIVENRTAALRDAGSYTSVWKMEFTEDGELVGSTTYTHAVDYENERASFGMLMESDGEVSSDYETFQADGQSYTRYGAGEEATYGVSDAPFAPGNTLFAVQSYVASSADLAGFEAVGTETYDGVTVTRYERTDRPTWVSGQSADGEFAWHEFTYTVLVDGDGLVRSEGWGGEGVTDDGVEQTVEFSYSLTAVGATTVEEPDWTAAAREQSGR